MKLWIWQEHFKRPPDSERWTDCELHQFKVDGEVFLELMFYDSGEIHTHRFYRLSKTCQSYERAAMSEYRRMLALTELGCAPAAKDVALMLQKAH